MRYAKDKTSRLRLAVTDEQKATAEALAKAREVSASEIVRRALDTYIAKSAAAPLSPNKQAAVVAATAPRVEAELGAIVKSLEALNERLGRLEERG